MNIFHIDNDHFEFELSVPGHYNFHSGECQDTAKAGFCHPAIDLIFMSPETPDLCHLQELLNRGKCCTAALVQMALGKRRERNDQLLSAAEALCGGVQTGRLCGALTGGALLINILAPDRAGREMIRELSRWFKEEFTPRYGGSDCKTILGGSDLNRGSRCPEVIETVFIKVMEILGENGIDTL